MLEECFGDGPFVFRYNDCGGAPELLNQVCLERGWKEYELNIGEDWNLWWKTTSFPISHSKTLCAWQFTNHVPKGSLICRKDNLVRYLRCMKSIYGTIYDYSPDGYNLPLEYTKLASQCTNGKIFSHNQEKNLEENPIWICKPVSKSQGRGIFLFKKLTELNYDTKTIVQKYIEKPLLIGGYKFDLRLYVCVPSYHPMTIYMYREGLARFGTDKFSLQDLRNRYGHLTNSSINKFGPNYTEMKDRIGAGCKWTLKQLRKYFSAIGISDWLLWQQISSLVILTVLSNANQVPPSANCFEFFGFDVLIDDNLKPWLLEVNISPGLTNDCDADIEVKKPMLHDMFDLLGLPIYNTGLSSYNILVEKFDPESSKDGNDLEFKTSDYHIKTQKNMKKRKTNTKKVTNSIKKLSAYIQTNSPINHIKFPKSHPKTPMYNEPRKSYQITRHTLSLDSHEILDERWKKNKNEKNWGNGVNWNLSKPSEGNWTRLWPMTKNESFKAFTEPIMDIRKVVLEMAKFLKQAKETAKKYPLGQDQILNEILVNKLQINCEIWLPPL